MCYSGSTTAQCSSRDWTADSRSRASGRVALLLALSSFPHQNPTCHTCLDYIRCVSATDGPVHALYKCTDTGNLWYPLLQGWNGGGWAPPSILASGSASWCTMTAPRLGRGPHSEEQSQPASLQIVATAEPRASNLSADADPLTGNVGHHI